MNIWKCSDCETNNARRRPKCQVCDRPRPASRVSGLRVSRVHINLRRP